MTSPWHTHFESLTKQVTSPPVVAAGKLVRGIGLTLEAVGCQLPVGSQCLVQTIEGEIEAEVVGFGDDITYLMPTEAVRGIVPGSRVMPLNRQSGLPVGMGLLGRVVDGNGQPLDGLGEINAEARAPTTRPPMNPLIRRPINTPMDVGVRAINALNTVGVGQRMGLFAGSGVGKSVLLGMMSRFTEADVVIVALVGERGKEVREFVESNLSGANLAKAVIVAAPADEMPVMRLRSGMYATRLAEYFRDKGKRTLLLFDSLTRYA